MLTSCSQELSLKRQIAKESGWYRNWSPYYAVAYRNRVKFLYSWYFALNQTHKTQTYLAFIVSQPGVWVHTGTHIALYLHMSQEVMGLNTMQKKETAIQRVLSARCLTKILKNYHINWDIRATCGLYRKLQGFRPHLTLTVSAPQVSQLHWVIKINQREH